MSIIQEFNEAIQNSIKGRINEIRTCIPAEIISYNHETKTATVRIMVKRRKKTENGIEQEIIPDVTNVPVRQPRTANAEIHMPVKKGDKVLLFVHDRDVDNYRKTGELSETITLRKHNITDSFCILNCFEDSNIVELDNGDENNLTLYHGETKLTIDATGSVKMGLRGSEPSNPIVLGDELKSLLERLLNILIVGDQCLTTSPGSPTIVNPARGTELTQIKADLITILSTKHFTSEE